MTDKTFRTSVDWEEVDRRLSEDPEALIAEIGGTKAKKDDGGAAFPSDYSLPENQGMTLRDYFAAKAMPVIMADLIQNSTKPEAADFAAVIAYKMADAMMRERAK